MFCSQSANPATRRYLRRFMVTMIFYAIFIVVSVSTFVHFRPTGIGAWVLAILPALGIIAQMGTFALYLREEKDEFIRNLQIQSMLWAIGATLSVTTIWGFLQGFLHVRPMDPIWVYPMYCILFGVCHGLVCMRYK